MTDPAKIAAGLALLALAGCDRGPVCVDGYLYWNEGSGIYAQDHRKRRCVDPADPAILERESHD
jgi:hypothetical protein